MIASHLNLLQCQLTSQTPSPSPLPLPLSYIIVAIRLNPRHEQDLGLPNPNISQPSEAYLEANNIDMEASWSGTPQTSIFMGFSIVNHLFWGTPPFVETPTCSGQRSLCQLPTGQASLEIAVVLGAFLRQEPVEVLLHPSRGGGLLRVLPGRQRYHDWGEWSPPREKWGWGWGWVQVSGGWKNIQQASMGSGQSYWGSNRVQCVLLQSFPKKHPKTKLGIRDGSFLMSLDGNIFLQVP